MCVSVSAYHLSIPDVFAAALLRSGCLMAFNLSAANSVCVCFVRKGKKVQVRLQVQESIQTI